MTYSEEKREKICPSCNTVNHIIVAYAGDYRANEREDARCYDCGEVVDREKCWAIFTGKTAEAALSPLRQLQNRT